ncbi:MAG: DUF255 domain-containing protein [Phycisphaerales bacterium]
MSERDPTALGNRPAPGASPVNRLGGSSSPYLLQHAHNPVPWWPWCDEAFEEARRRDVPVFLSVGYSTCYWCHVMERESFEDAAIGAILARDYVPIKLDREEHPEIDEIYMAAIQMLTGRGGWPMSVFLEPESRRPFWGGTYFPPQPAHGLPSFAQVLEGLSDTWRTRRGDILKQATTIAEAVQERLDSSGAHAVLVGRPQVAMGVQTLLTIFDRTHGGFGGAPKFPQPVYFEFLLDARERLDDPDGSGRAAIDLAIRKTLDAMTLGGMHDQVGGGFHRYSVDAAWIVPHFEKMLYDQAQLISVYARAARVYDDGLYARTARRIAAYVAREMTSPEGWFFSAQDAEVDGREGRNYLWTREELREALGPADGEVAHAVFGLTRGPNFRDPHHPDEPARSVLVLDEHPAATAARTRGPVEQVYGTLDRLASALLDARSRRKAPRLDDKLIVSWNGMMISGLATAGRALEDETMIAAARTAAGSILTHMRAGDGTLWRCRREGRSSIPAVLEDYAWLAHGLLTLAEAESGNAGNRWRDEAERLIGAALPRFGLDDGRLFDAPASPTLFVRARSTYDGATPSAGSVMLECLVRLASAGGPNADAWLRAASAALAAVSGPIAESPLAAINSTRSLLKLITLDEAALVGALSSAGAAPGWSAEPQAAVDDAIVIHASADEVVLGPDLPAEVRLRVTIAAGYHVSSAEPGDSPEANALVPTRVGVVGGTGVAAFAEMPAGEPLDSGDPASPSVYRGEIEFPVALELSGVWSGRPRLAVTYQACTDRSCFEPRTVELGVEIDRTGQP